MESDSDILRLLQTSPKGTSLTGRVRKMVDAKKSNSDPDMKKQAKAVRKTTQKSSKQCDNPKPLSEGKERAKQLVDIAVGTELTFENIDAWTPNNETVLEMLSASAPTDTYWKLYAEERRRALEETLKENLGCYQEIARLKEENRQLRATVSELQEYADMVRQAMEEENETSDTE